MLAVEDYAVYGLCTGMNKKNIGYHKKDIMEGVFQNGKLHTE